MARKIVFTVALTFVSLALLYANADEQNKDAKKSPDQEQMQGKWKVVRYESTGRPGQAEYKEPDTISGDKWLRPMRTTDEYQLKLDPTKEPKWVDLSAKRLGEKTLKGIYKIDGNKLTICYAYDPELPRPAEFKTTTDKRGYLYVLERVKKE
jgi:uncharacterized protein (TIGR03067 family)